MDIITVTNNDTNEVIAVYTPEKFLEEANAKQWEANNFNGDRECFNLDMLEYAMTCYKYVGENLSVNKYTVEDVDHPCQEVTLTEGDWHDTVINDELLVHIKRNDVGYSVDLYNVKDLSDDGFISSATAFDDDFVNVDDDGWNDEV